MIQITLLFLLLIVISAVCVGLFRQYALMANLLDNPNERSSHTVPTPRGGGAIFVVFWFILAAGLIIGSGPSATKLLFLLLAPLLVALVSYCDDKWSLRARTRASVHLLSATIALIMLGGVPTLSLGQPLIINTAWLATPIALLLLIWSVNLFNFMDGTDGIAAIEALFVLGIGALIFYLAADPLMSILSGGLAALVLGFLFWNWPVARIFMGDVGSTFLGFILILFALIGQRYDHIPIALWLMIYGIFLFDATITLLRRILKGERWYEAHRSHAYQRLHQAGWSHKKVLMGVIAVNVGLAFITLWANQQRHILLYALIASYLFLGLLYWVIERKKPMY